jgi:Domain of unknown function (DU1801)
MAKMAAKPISVASFLQSIEDRGRRKECRTLLALLRAAVPGPAKMWGPAMVGIGDLHYRYASGREGDTFILGFASRKSGITVYLGWSLEPHRKLLNQLGKHTVGKGCLYLRRLDDVDQQILAQLLQAAALHNTKSPPH